MHVAPKAASVWQSKVDRAASGTPALSARPLEQPSVPLIVVERLTSFAMPDVLAVIGSSGAFVMSGIYSNYG